jgi:phospholipid/cholesterol/gamma-HCH transport system substrate-binding protein
MSDRRADIQVGLFAIIGVLLLAMMILIFGGFKNVLVTTYEVTAHFENAAGTTEGTPVRLLGIEVGRVQSVGLDTERGGVLMTLAINGGVDIRADAPLAIKQEGFIANSYLDFGQGSSGEYLPTDGTARVEGGIDTFASYVENATEVLGEMGGTIQQRVAAVTDRLMTLTDSVNAVVGDEEFQKDVKDLAANSVEISAALKERLPSLMDNLNETAETVNARLEETSELLETYNDLGEELTGLAADGREHLARQSANLDKLTASLSGAAESIGELAANLTEIAGMVKGGEGTAGKLFTDAELYRTLVDAIDEVEGAARIFKDLAETIKRHPDWLLKGAPKDRR